MYHLKLKDMWFIIFGIVFFFVGLACILYVFFKHNTDKKTNTDKVLTISTVAGIIQAIAGVVAVIIGIISLGQNSPNNDIKAKTHSAIETPSNTSRQHTEFNSNPTEQSDKSSSDSSEQSQPITTELLKETTSPNNNQQDRVVIESIYGVSDVVVVNLKIKEYFKGKVNVSVTKDDICTLDNGFEFPQDLWGDQPTFCVKLKRNPYRFATGNKSKFVIDIIKDYSSGSYSEVKEVDISQYIEKH
jgi:hypothetical protein